SGAELAALPDSVKLLEVRADLLGDLNVNWLRRHFKGELLYVLRSHAERGHSFDSPNQRRKRLTAAARYYDQVELEYDRDFSASLLGEIPAAKCILSWHGPAVEPSELLARFREMASVPAVNYKLVTWADKLSAEFTCVSVLRSMGP